MSKRDSYFSLLLNKKASVTMSREKIFPTLLIVTKRHSTRHMP